MISIDLKKGCSASLSNFRNQVQKLMIIEKKSATIKVVFTKKSKVVF